MGRSNQSECNLYGNGMLAKCENMNNFSDLKDVPSTITHLEITNSNLPTLNFALFPSQFLNLKSIVFDGCKIEYIKIGMNLQFTEIRNLSIRNNDIDIIRENSFQQFPNVEIIDFVHNGVTKIYEDGFKDLFRIQVINLTNNSIEKIENEAFKNLPKLEVLDLSFNDNLQPFTYGDESRPKIITSSSENSVNFSSNRKQNESGWFTDIIWFYICGKISGIFTGGWLSTIWYYTGEWLSNLWYYTGGLLSGTWFYIGLTIVLLSLFLVSCTGCAVCLSSIIIKDKQNEQNKIQRFLSSTYDREIGQIKLENRIADNVWAGTLQDGRRTAVKKYRKASSSQPEKELDILLHMSNTKPNPHIVQYYCKQEKDGFLYVALEMCESNLEEAIIHLKKKKIESSQFFLQGKRCLGQITDGLWHVHKQGIQHQDIKPANILLKRRGDGFYFLISDFDLGHFEKDYSEHKKPNGSIGWAAPELWQGGKRTSAVDIFSLGCVFYYVLAKGRHPFGPIDNLEQCQQTICQSTEQPKLTKLQELGQSFTTVLAKSLINSMLERDFRKRPKVMSVVEHPMFWNEEKISKFYHNIGKMSVDKEQETFQRMLRADSSEVYSTGDWTSYLDTIVKCDVDKRMDRADICKLLRFIRNKTEHFDELSEELKHTYYCCSEGVARYFNEKFTKLLLYTFQKKEELDQVNRKKRN